MNKYRLAEEIINFCGENHIFGNANIDTSANKIAEQLEESWFVEHFIFTLITKTKNKKNIDFKKLKELLLELEKIRLDLEYGE